MPVLGRVYTIDLAPTAVTVAADLVEITPADDKPIRIISTNLHQTSDFGDAQDEVLSVFWIRGHTTSGSGGSAPTPRPGNHNDTAAGFTAEAFNTTAASVGTTVNLNRHGVNVRAPMERPYTPEEMPEASQTNTTLILRMAAAPADSITIGGSITVEELG
jgi:hypothetical protein